MSFIYLSKSRVNYVVKVCKVYDYHDGESVWREFGEIKRVVVNDFTELYMKDLPGGQLPSRKSKEEIIEKTGKEVFPLAGVSEESQVN